GRNRGRRRERDGVRTQPHHRRRPRPPDGRGGRPERRPAAARARREGRRAGRPDREASQPRRRVPGRHRSLAARRRPLMTFLRDTGLVFWSQLRANLRNPVWVIIGLSQPVLYLVLFGPLLEGIGDSLGPGADPWLIFAPGLIMQIGLFAALFVGFALVDELRAGLIARQRVTPASRGALLLGRVCKDMTVLIVQASILTLVAAVFFGLRPNLVGVVLTLALVAVVAAGLACASYALALRTRSEDSLASVLNTVSVPALLLSGILLPMTIGPQWLQNIAAVNPLSHTVDAARALFRGDLGDQDVFVGAAVTLAFAIVLAVIGARTFARENA